MLLLWVSCRGGRAEADLHALDLQLHVVLSRCFSILPFLPAVSVLPILHLLPVVEDDAAVLRPETETSAVLLACCDPFSVDWQALRCVPGFQGAGEPLIMSVEWNQVGSNLLQKQRHLSTWWQIIRGQRSERGGALCRTTIVSYCLLCCTSHSAQQHFPSCGRHKQTEGSERDTTVRLRPERGAAGRGLRRTLWSHSSAKKKLINKKIKDKR